MAGPKQVPLGHLFHPMIRTECYAEPVSSEKTNIFAPPAQSRQVWIDAKRGLSLAAKTLLAIATAILLFGGFAILHLPKDTESYSFARRNPLIFGPLFLIVAAAILIGTIKRWARILPGILGYGAFGGLITIATGGYGKYTIPRLEALTVTLLLVTSSLLAVTFQDRLLTLLDKMILLISAFSMAGSASVHSSSMFIFMGIGVCCLLFGWHHNRSETRGQAGLSPDGKPGPDSSPDAFPYE